MSATEGTGGIFGSASRDWLESLLMGSVGLALWSLLSIGFILGVTRPLSALVTNSEGAGARQNGVQQIDSAPREAALLAPPTCACCQVCLDEAVDALRMQ